MKKKRQIIRAVKSTNSCVCDFCTKVKVVETEYGELILPMEYGKPFILEQKA